jgi:hypothetical protein
MPTTKFQRPETYNLATIRQKIGEAESEVLSAEEALNAISLTAALADDNSAGVAAVERLNDARNNLELLRSALVNAERAERERQRRDQIEQRRAALKQLGAVRDRIVGQAKAIETALQVYCTAYREMAAIGAEAVALLPPNDRPTLGAVFSEVRFREEVTLELTRLGGGTGALTHGGRQPVPGCPQQFNFGGAAGGALTREMAATHGRARGIADIDRGLPLRLETQLRNVEQQLSRDLPEETKHG